MKASASEQLRLLSRFLSSVMVLLFVVRRRVGVSFRNVNWHWAKRVMDLLWRKCTHCTSHRESMQVSRTSRDGMMKRGHHGRKGQKGCGGAFGGQISFHLFHIFPIFPIRDLLILFNPRDVRGKMIDDDE